MDRNRSLPQFHGADPPTYLDPDDVQTPPLGTFQTDLSQPLTPLTPEHANLITEELRNATVGLGFPAASNIDTQLRDALVPALRNVKIGVPPSYGRIESGTWTFIGPVTVISNTEFSRWVVPLPLAVGARINSISVRSIENNPIQRCFLQLWRITDEDGGTEEQIGPTITLPESTSYVTTIGILSTPHTVADDYQYYLIAEKPSASLAFTFLRMFWLEMDLCGAPA